MWNLFSFRKLREPIRRKPIRKMRLALEELEARLTPSDGLDFSNGFANAAGLLSFNGTTSLIGSRLEFTNGGPDRAAAASSLGRVGTGKIHTPFTFQFT